MVQYWRLYNLDKQSYIDFSKGRFRLGEWFFTDDPTRLLSKLRRNGATESWAGDRMICFGCHAESVPKGVMSDGEIAMLKVKRVVAKLKARIEKDGEEEEEEEENIYDQETQHILDEIGSEDHVPEPENFDYSIYVSRNLTKKMYIRGNNTPVGIPNRVRDSFGQMLFQNVCWSDELSSSMESCHDLIRGEWAGDRFDVVEFETVKDELSKDGWVDCTDELKEKVKRLYIANNFLDSDEDLSRALQRNALNDPRDGHVMDRTVHAPGMPRYRGALVPLQNGPVDDVDRDVIVAVIRALTSGRNVGQPDHQFQSEL